MDPELLRHADPGALWTWALVALSFVFGAFVFGASKQWLDWLDERRGRGGIRDDWVVDDLEEAVAAYRRRHRAH